MKKKKLLFLITIITTCNIYAQISWENLEYTSTTKLEIFAKGCNSSQIKRLLDKDSVFEINYGQITLTPVQLAIHTFIKANNAGEIWKCDECINSVVAILNDPRYNFRLQPFRSQTDLIYALKREKDLNQSDNLITQRFEFLLFNMLKILDKKTDFDIQYSIGTFVDGLNGNPGTAFEASSAFGNASFCILINRYPILLKDIDARSGANKFTPLMYASRFNNLKTAEKLLFYGADYLKKFTAYKVTGIPVVGISKRAGNTVMTTFLENYINGKEHVKGCK
ncbi:hypothetical protein [Wenyingzhuangia sp. IMCC45574]